MLAHYPQGRFALDRSNTNREAMACDSTVMFSPSDIDVDDGADPWWDSTWMRERHKFLKGVDGFGIDTVASLDFGLLWGANVNASLAAVWIIIEVFKDRGLLARVRGELEESKFQGSVDIPNLVSLPVLQSVYVETLRVRVEAVAIL
ncbi:MAG: hypothetical protein Q9213_007254 [Squamulea squamosa]